MQSFNGRAQKEVAWRNKNWSAIKTVGRYSGLCPMVVGSNLSKKIYGGRVAVYKRGELIGYR